MRKGSGWLNEKIRMVISRATEHERKGRPWKESVNEVIGVYEGGMW